MPPAAPGNTAASGCGVRRRGREKMRRPLLSSGHIVGVVALTFSVSILGRAQSPDSAGTHKRAAATKTTPAHPTTKQRARSATRIPLTKQEAGGEVDLAPSTDTAA